MLYNPGQYEAVLQYYNGSRTVARWHVREITEQKKAKNVVIFIGDGMTTPMITAARLIGHPSINGKYQTKMAMDGFPVVGHRMVHAMDSFITDSASSASSLYTGHKTTDSAMGVYVDSSPDPFDDPKVETIVEMLHRIWGSSIGVVTTSYLSDATVTALTGHSKSRGLAMSLTEQQLSGVTANYTWTNWNGPDVLFGGGAEHFVQAGGFGKFDHVGALQNRGYAYVQNKTGLARLIDEHKALGLFCQGALPTWFDRNVFPGNLKLMRNHPQGGNRSAADLPGLKDMTLKAVDILHHRGGDRGFFLMSEAAGIDKQMHNLDYDRSLGELLELDDTIKATIQRLKQLGVLNDTLILVTADHGHGFDVYGSVDTEYMHEFDNHRERRDAIGVYGKSGMSQYQVAQDEDKTDVMYPTPEGFPKNWSPRYTLAMGTVAFPDKNENFSVHATPREVTVQKSGQWIDNVADGLDGIRQEGNLPSRFQNGVHSLADVPIYAMGPCKEMFQGTMDNTDIFFKMASCLGLARRDNSTGDLAAANTGRLDACTTDPNGQHWCGMGEQWASAASDVGEPGVLATLAITAAVVVGVFGMLEW